MVEAAWVLPKLVDYDPRTRAFRYDERQALKLPDWTYEEPPTIEPRPSFAPARKASGDVSVRIANDLAEAFERIAQGQDTDLGHEIDVALREWLASRTSPD